MDERNRIRRDLEPLLQERYDEIRRKYMNWNCPNCGWWNVADEKTCTNCGADSPLNTARFPLWLLGAALVVFIIGLVAIVAAEELGLVP